MQLNRIDDPRDKLSKARRGELVKYARANGIRIDPNMPALLMRELLRQQGLTNPQIPNRPLGSQVQNGAPVAPGQQNEASALADLARQWQQEQPAPPTAMGINELRAECRRLGIKLGRRDNMQTMREKIEAHGQNAA